MIKPTKKTASGGSFSANSLGSLQRSRKPINMKLARANIRRNKQTLKELLKPRPQHTIKKEIDVKQWWDERSNWKSYVVGNKLGKINPKARAFVEFVDGTYHILNI